MNKKKKEESKAEIKISYKSYAVSPKKNFESDNTFQKPS
jgi:hypothetical protein